MYVHKVSSVEAVDFHILRISIHIASFPNHAHQHIVNYLSITINIPSTTSLFSTISISSTLRCYQPIMSSTVSASRPIILNFCSFSKSSTPSPFPSAYDQLPLHSHQHIINFVPSMLSSIKSAYQHLYHQIPRIPINRPSTPTTYSSTPLPTNV